LTGENRKCNADDEIERAWLCLDEARTLVWAG